MFCCLWAKQQTSLHGARTLTKLLGGRWEAKLNHGWASHFRNDKDHRDFTAIGAAAGMQLCSTRHLLVRLLLLLS
jgi:hypothetical protein